MSVESADWISDLDPTNPPNGDSIGEGPAHIRLIKGKLIATFPNVNGPITTTDENLNNPILSTTRPLDGIPIYTATGADVLTLSAFGKSLLTGTADGLNGTLGIGGYVQKSGDTMTGPLTTPVVNLGTGGFTLGMDAGNPKVTFANGMYIIVDVVNQSMNFVVGNKIGMILNKDGNLFVRGDVKGYSI
jgi:hypothetical protein